MSEVMRPRPENLALTGPLTDESFYSGDPFPHFAEMRAEAPVLWHPDPGYWVVTSHAGAMEVSTDVSRFSSTGGVIPLEIGIEYPSPPTMMHTDPPLHTEYRKRVAAGFRPSRIRRMEDMITDRIGSLACLDVTGSSEARDIDLHSEVSIPFPLMVIADLLGVDRSDWPQFYTWSEATIPDATDWSAEEKARLLDEMKDYLMKVVSERRARPAHDMISDLVAEDDESGLAPIDDDEAWMFVNQLLVAGNETTRNLISGGMAELALHPDQFTAMAEDRSLVAPMIDEMLRWSTPVISFMRTATLDTAVQGVPIRRGDPILMMYSSANRDEHVFGQDANRFRATRSPNPHLAFGFGAHYCVGAALARLEVSVLLNLLADRFARIEPAGPARRSPSSIIAGWNTVPLTLTECR